MKRWLFCNNVLDTISDKGDNDSFIYNEILDLKMFTCAKRLEVVLFEYLQLIYKHGM